MSTTSNRARSRRPLARGIGDQRQNAEIGCWFDPRRANRISSAREYLLPAKIMTTSHLRMFAPGSRASATILSFAIRDHRRRGTSGMASSVDRYLLFDQLNAVCPGLVSRLQSIIRHQSAEGQTSPIPHTSRYTVSNDRLRCIVRRRFTRPGQKPTGVAAALRRSSAIAARNTTSNAS